jgi:hypothetical protein
MKVRSVKKINLARRKKMQFLLEFLQEQALIIRNITIYEGDP